MAFDLNAAIRSQTGGSKKSTSKKSTSKKSTSKKSTTTTQGAKRIVTFPGGRKVTFTVGKTNKDKKRTPSPYNKYMSKRIKHYTSQGIDAKNAMKKAAKDWNKAA